MRLGVVTIVVLGCSAPPPPCPCAAPPPPVASVTCPASASVAEAPPAPPLSCGQLALREARLVAGGKGDKHPELIDVRVRLSQCADRRPSPSDCIAVRKTGIELASKYGPKHPERLMNDAEQTVCNQSAPPPPPPTPSCAPGLTMCGSGPHSACCGSGQMCCAGGAAGSYYCKNGTGMCPPLP